MKKSTRIVKRLLALFLVVLMSIESFGALVSDNDGSAFITKGEFDSLRSDFQTQINNYNTALDNKIDGAIAAYLAGISVKNEPFVMLDRIKSSIGRDLRFYNSYPTGTDLTTRYIVNKEKSYSILYKNADDGGWREEDPSAWRNKHGSQYARGMSVSTIGANSKIIIWNGSTKIKTIDMVANTTYRVMLGGYGNQNVTISYNSTSSSEADPGSWSTTTANSSNPCPTATASIGRHIHIKLPNGAANGFIVTQYSSVGNWTYSNLTDSSFVSNASSCGYYKDAIEYKPHYLFQTNWDRAGSGTCWVSELNPNGNRRLLGYRTNYPLVVLNISSKWWQNKGTVALGDNVFNFTTAHSHTLNLPTTWSYATSGTHYTSYNTNNNSWWYLLICNLYTEAMQRTYVQVDQFGGGTNAVLKYIDLYAQPNYVNEIIASNLSYAQSVHTIEGYSASLGAINITVSPSARGVGLTVDEAPMDWFENIYLSAVAGETVWMGGGAPLMEMQSAKDTEYEVTMKLRLCTGSGGPPESGSTKQAYVMLSKNQFWDGLFRAADDILFDDTVTFDSTGNATLVIDGLTDVDKGKKVWYNLRAYTNGYYVECTECKVKVK